MPKFCPNEIPEEFWHELAPGRAYGIRSTRDDTVFLRLCQGHGVCLGITAAPNDARMISFLENETGAATVLGRLSQEASVVVGRSTKANIQVESGIVSRQHLELTLSGSVLMVRDLNSTNGTFVFTQNVYFDIDKYIEQHSQENPMEGTLDSVFEAFGPALGEFLKRYQEKGKG